MYVPRATQRAKEGLAHISKCMTLREFLGHQHQLVRPPSPPSSRLNASNLSQLAWQSGGAAPPQLAPSRLADGNCGFVAAPLGCSQLVHQIL